MKRSQKFKRSSNPLLSWIWTKISVDIKAQGAVNVRHCIPLFLSLRSTLLFSGLWPDWMYSHVLLKKCWYYISVSVFETDIVHGLNVLWTMAFTELGIRAWKVREKRQPKDIPTCGNLRKHRSRCGEITIWAKFIPLSDQEEETAPFRTESVSFHMGRCLVVKIVR